MSHKNPVLWFSVKSRRYSRGLNVLYNRVSLVTLSDDSSVYRVWVLTYELHPVLMFHLFFFGLFFFSSAPSLYNRDSTNKGTCQGKLPLICRHVGCLGNGFKVVRNWRQVLCTAVTGMSQSGANARATGQITSARLLNNFETRARRDKKKNTT